MKFITAHRRWIEAACLTLLSVSFPAGTRGQSNPLPFAFGTSVGDYYLGPNDDNSTEAIFLFEPVTFYGVLYDFYYQSTNGYINFDYLFESTYAFQPFPDPFEPPMLAGFYTDMFISDLSARVEGALWTRASVETSDLDVASSIVQSSGDPDAAGFQATNAIVATWDRVEQFGGPQRLRNTFQIAMAYNSINTWVIFAYKQLTFFAEGLSLVGINDPAGVSGFTIAVMNSTEDLQQLLTGSNIGVSGVYVYRVDQKPSCSFLVHQLCGCPALLPCALSTIRNYCNIKPQGRDLKDEVPPPPLDYNNEQSSENPPTKAEKDILRQSNKLC